MKAIQTRYLPPASVRGARIKASDCDGNSVTISYPHEFSGERTHWEAAAALCSKMGWSGVLHGGALAAGEYVFVFDHQLRRYVVSPTGKVTVFGEDDWSVLRSPTPEAAR